MTLDEMRKDMTEWLERVSKEDPKGCAAGITLQLVEIYGQCDAVEKAFAIQVLSEWVLSGHDGKYGVASSALVDLKIYDSGTILRMRLESGPWVKPHEPS